MEEHIEALATRLGISTDAAQRLSNAYNEAFGYVRGDEVLSDENGAVLNDELREVVHDVLSPLVYALRPIVDPDWSQATRA